MRAGPGLHPGLDQPYQVLMAKIAAPLELPDITLRAVQDEDGVSVAGLIAACFAEYDGCQFSWDEFPELMAPAAWAASRGTRFWIAEGKGGEIAGCICATPDAGEREAGVQEPDVRVELHKFYVASHLRGSGLAGILIAKVFELARDTSASAIFLWTDIRFARAHSFYEKHGFVRQPGSRLLHDISDTTEFHYRREL